MLRRAVVQRVDELSDEDIAPHDYDGHDDLDDDEHDATDGHDGEEHADPFNVPPFGATAGDAPHDARRDDRRGGK